MAIDVNIPTIPRFKIKSAGGGAACTIEIESSKGHSTKN